jgi:type I restriction enzyme S subunit
MICQISRWKDLDRWIPGGDASWDVMHPLGPIEDLVTPRLERVQVKRELGDWQPITIHFDGSVVPRDRKTPFKGSMFAAYPGDLVFSKIDARNGAIGLVPEALSKVVVTSEYPVHQPDSNQVDVRYLALILRTPNFLSLIRRAASGTSGRKRITPENFRAIQIPLPDPKDQRRLVAAYYAALAKADQLDAQARQIEREAQQEFEAALGLTPPPNLPKRRFQIGRFRGIERWSHEGILQNTLLGGAPPESKFEIVQLGDIATVSYGLQKCPANRPRKHARPYLRVANVQRGYLDIREIKTIDVPDPEMPKYRLAEGDILLCEGNSADLVGRGAIWKGEIVDCVHQNHVLRVRLDQHRTIPEFILAYINSPSGQAYFRSKAKRTTNLASINSTEVANLPVPLPDDTATQTAIVRRLRKGREAAAAKRKQADALRTSAWNDFISAVFV